MKYTQDFYGNLQTAYDFFNEELFENTLPQCMVTLNRKNKCVGYYCHKVFTNKDGEVIDEIALNPDYLSKQTPKQLLSTLIHEMVHLLMTVRGVKGKKGHHSQEFCEFMIGIGLQTIDSETGENITSGGKKVSDYIIDGDLFDLTCDKLLETVTFDLVNLPNEEVKKPRVSNRTKYVCKHCGTDVSGKKGIVVKCGNPECQDEVMEDEEGPVVETIDNMKGLEDLD